MSGDLRFTEQGSYWFGGLLPTINHRAFDEGSMLVGTSLDYITTTILRFGPSDAPDDGNPDFFEFEKLVSLTALVHERFHYTQDLLFGFGHLAYELQCLLFKGIQTYASNSSLDFSEPRSRLEIQRWQRLRWIYRLLTDRVGGMWIIDPISEQAPGYDWTSIRESSCLELLETQAALHTYLDLHTRLSVVPEVQDLLHAIHVEKMAPRYKTLFDFFIHVVAGKEAYSLIHTSDSDLGHFYELNLFSFACILIELSLHVPPVEVFYDTWGDGSKVDKWLQFHPLYKFAASCSALDYLNSESHGKTLLSILQGDINVPKLIRSIESKYRWWIPYHEITDMWAEYYGKLGNKGPIEILRQKVAKLRQKDPILVLQVADPLRYFEIDAPLFAIANGELFQFSAGPSPSLRVGPMKEIRGDAVPLFESLREHRMKLSLLTSLLADDSDSR